jgi:O-antigen/teichoic acid export membrane protein
LTFNTHSAIVSLFCDPNHGVFAKPIRTIQVKPPRQSDNPPPADPDRYLRVDHLTADLRGRSVRGGAVTLAGQAGKFVITLASMAVLARILTPEDFGLIAMATVVIGFTSVFKDMGLSMATVQRTDVRHTQVSTLFWLNVIASVAIAAATAAAAPLLAWFYKEPRVTAVTLALAATVLIGGFAIQHQALLRRQMRFGALAFVEIASLVLAGAGAIASALAGHGYWALVVLAVVREIAAVCLMWITCRWRPDRPVRRSGVRSLVSFGAHLSGFNVLTYVSRNIEKMLIGWYWGPGPVGLYNNADRILLLPLQQINTPLTSVAVPALSRIQNDLERYRSYYRRGVLLTVTAAMPIVVFLFVAADKAVLVFLGGQWAEAVPIFRALGPAAFIGTFNVATGWVFVSLGTTRRQFHWGLFSTAVTVLAYVIGLPWGPIGVALGFSATFVVLRIPSVLYCFRGTPLKMKDLGGAIWRPAFSSVAAGALLYGFNRAVGVPGPLAVSLALDFAVYAVFYVLAWIGLPGGRRSLGEIAAIARGLKTSRPAPEGVSSDTDIA